jgi:hypothetical protein
MRDRHSSTQAQRVRDQTELRALEVSKRVTWQCLAATADEYTEWQVFGLWLRAVGDVAGDIPPLASQELESRTPRLPDRLRPGIETAVQYGDSPGASIWSAVNQWAERNIFETATREGWLEAVQYFSAMSLCSMKAWSYWEFVDKQWRVDKPNDLPSYPQWKSAVASVTRLSNPDSEAQQVLDAIREVSQDKWNMLLRDFSDLIVFSQWMELVFAIEGSHSALLSRELAARYRGFVLTHASTNSKDCVRALSEWVISNGFGITNQTQLLGALGFQVRHHPQYPAVRSYAIRCHDVWSGNDRGCLPSFDEWRGNANEYCDE